MPTGSPDFSVVVICYYKVEFLLGKQGWRRVVHSSDHCGRPRVNAICGLSLLLVLSFATKKRDARAKLLFCVINLLLF